MSPKAIEPIIHTTNTTKRIGYRLKNVEISAHIWEKYIAIL